MTSRCGRLPIVLALLAVTFLEGVFKPVGTLLVTFLSTDIEIGIAGEGSIDDIWSKSPPTGVIELPGLLGLCAISSKLLFLALIAYIAAIFYDLFYEISSSVFISYDC